MKNIKLVMVLIAAVLIGLSVYIICTTSSIPAAWRRDAFKKRMFAKQEQIYNTIGLTDAQKKLLEENRNKYREQKKVLFTQMHQRMNLLRQELEKSELNMQEIYQTNDELKQLQDRLLDQRLECILQIRQILSPEQFKKFEDKINESARYFKDRRARKKDWHNNPLK